MTPDIKMKIKKKINELLLTNSTVTIKNAIAATSDVPKDELAEDELFDFIVFLERGQGLKVIKDGTGEWRVFNNPAYPSLRNADITNQSVRKTNSVIRLWTAVNAIAAAALTVTTLITCDRQQIKEVKLIRESLQNIEQNQETFRLYLQGVHYWMFAPYDSLKRQPHKP